MNKIKIAFVHDDFIQFGGAEKFFLDFILTFKNDTQFEITVFSSLISPSWKRIFKEREIFYKESFLKNFPFCYKFSKLFFLVDLYYLSFQDFDFEEYDFVFSSSTRYAHSIFTKPNTFHISYINSLPKMYWEPEKYYSGKKFLKFLIKNFFPTLRLKDFYTQLIPDLVITNSLNIQKKLKKNFKRNSIILYPFLTIKYEIDSRPREYQDYHLVISRLVSWKRIDYVLTAFNQLPTQKLKIIGSGPLFDYYKSKSFKNIEFLGYVSEELKQKLLNNAKSLIVPQDEDFGLVYIEAMRCKVPVIYLNKGGACEILNEKIGVPFNSQDSISLIKSIEILEKKSFSSQDFKDVIKKLEKIDTSKFIKKLISLKRERYYFKDNK